MSTSKPPMPEGLIFREEGEELKLVGNFEQLYQQVADPWEQSGMPTLSRAKYYDNSRARLVDAVRKLTTRRRWSGLEVGCGHGHLLYHLRSVGGDWTGIDISPTAIRQAKVLWPNQQFWAMDITKPSVLRYMTTHQVIVLAQLWWYILENMHTVLVNCVSNLTDDGYLVVSQAFLRGEQRYGREIANGFQGALRLLLNFPELEVIHANLEHSGNYIHDDGIIVLRKKT